MLEQLTLELFLPHLKTQFQIQLEKVGPVPILLAEAREISSWQPKESIRKPFSLYFHASPSYPMLAQGSYTVTHPVMEEMVLFLVPVSFDVDGCWYEALFT